MLWPFFGVAFDSNAIYCNWKQSYKHKISLSNASSRCGRLEKGSQLTSTFVFVDILILNSPDFVCKIVFMAIGMSNLEFVNRHLLSINTGEFNNGAAVRFFSCVLLILKGRILCIAKCAQHPQVYDRVFKMLWCLMSLLFGLFH